MKKIVKAVYILVVAIVVLTGALLIIKGLEENRTAGRSVSAIFEYSFQNEEGSAL